MESMKNEHSTTEMADALEVSASGYAEHLKKHECPRRREDQELDQTLAVIFKENRKTYRAPAAQVRTASCAEEAVPSTNHAERSALARVRERTGQSANT
jgi:hypothetical protein